MHQGIL